MGHQAWGMFPLRGSPHKFQPERCPVVLGCCEDTGEGCTYHPPRGTSLSATHPSSPRARTSSNIENQWGTVGEAAQSMLHENSLEEQGKKY